MSLFTVITVTYNARQTIELTIKSVQEQTYKQIEHIIVDGKSTDGTIELIQQLKDENTQWISEKDNGIYDAMNKASSLSKGSYICYLNAGDTFYEKGIAKSRDHLIHTVSHIPSAQFVLNLNADIMADMLFGATISKPFVDLLFLNQQIDMQQVNTAIEQSIQALFKM